MTETVQQRGRIGVLMGGYSSEREISLKSGRAVLLALQEAGCDVIALDIVSEDLDAIARQIRGASLCCAFIALHGRLGEDGTIQTLLEGLGIPYTGSGPQASQLALNKIATQKLFKKNGIPVPAHVTLAPENLTEDGVLTVAQISASIAEVRGFPIVVKPATEGSSIGIAFVNTPEGLASAIRAAAAYGGGVLLEEYIHGAEYTVGILDHTALPVIEIKPHRDFFDYTAKYQAGMTDYIVPASIMPEVSQQLQHIALAAHDVLGCQGMSRVDILVKDGKPYVLEVNTIPGFTSTSLLPKAAKCRGISFNQLCLTLIELAYGTKEKNNVTSILG